MTHKKCSSCLKKKEVEEFYSKGIDRHGNKCRESNCIACSRANRRARKKIAQEMERDTLLKAKIVETNQCQPKGREEPLYA